jgi:hypothetical protein
VLLRPHHLLFWGFQPLERSSSPLPGAKFDCKGFRWVRDLPWVVGKSNKGSFVEFLCIHHSTETQNHRELEHNVEKDPEGRIVSRRKRGDTQVNQKLDCRW